MSPMFVPGPVDVASEVLQQQTKPILELNMRHDMVKALETAKIEGHAVDVADIAALLLDQAHILDGELPSDPTSFARRLNAYVVRATKHP